MLIAGDRIRVNDMLQSGLAIETDGVKVVCCRPLMDDTPDFRVPLLMPGCTDLQVNGGGGVLLNTDPSVEGMQAIANAHRKLGTAQILPTLITDIPDVMEAAADAAIASKRLPGIAGIHLEGPHISTEKRGTHATRFIRPLDDQTIAVLARLRQAGIPVLLTLAPELADPSQLRRIAAMGVVLSAGHSMATAEQAREAMLNGVNMFTHLYNAMPQMTSRNPGMIAAAILSDAYCGLIADGIHVNPEMLKLTLSARPRPDRCFLVSDAMPTVGGPDNFDLYGMNIRVKDGALVNSEGSLAGVHIDMITSIRRLVQMTGIGLNHAIAMATDIPRMAMGLPPLSIAPGTDLADLVALDDDLNLIGIPDFTR